MSTSEMVLPLSAGFVMMSATIPGPKSELPAAIITILVAATYVLRFGIISFCSCEQGDFLSPPRMQAEKALKSRPTITSWVPLLVAPEACPQRPPAPA